MTPEINAPEWSYQSLYLLRKWFASGGVSSLKERFRVEDALASVTSFTELPADIQKLLAPYYRDVEDYYSSKG